MGDDFNTAQATKSVRQLISITRNEMNKVETSFQTSDAHQLFGGPKIAAVAGVLNFVFKYFSSLGFNSITVIFQQKKCIFLLLLVLLFFLIRGVICPIMRALILIPLLMILWNFEGKSEITL